MYCYNEEGLCDEEECTCNRVKDEERYKCKDTDHWNNILIGLKCRDKYCITNK